MPGKGKKGGGLKVKNKYSSKKRKKMGRYGKKK
jgi:hypothetical protein